jgi:hypothetical protein
VLINPVAQWVTVVPTLTEAVIGVSLFVILACGAGVIFINEKSEGDELWVPQDTQVMKNRDIVTARYGSPPSWQSTILSSALSPNALTPEGVDAMYDLEVGSREGSANSKPSNPKPYTPHPKR